MGEQIKNKAAEEKITIKTEPKNISRREDIAADKILAQIKAGYLERLQKDNPSDRDLRIAGYLLNTYRAIISEQNSI